MWPTGIGASAAGASAWARYRALAAEHRVERLAVGVVLAVSTGIMVAGVAGPLPAVCVAVAVLVVHQVGLWLRPGPLSGWRRGAVAERRTGGSLAVLDQDYYHVLHDRVLPRGTRTNLDHLVVGPTGVYAVVTRRWRRGRRLWVDRHRLWAGGTPITALSDLAVRIARLVSDLLAIELGREVPVSPLVAVHGARLPRGGIRHGKVVLQRARRLPELIDGRPVLLDDDEVRTILAAAERVLPAMPLDTVAHAPISVIPDV